MEKSHKSADVAELADAHGSGPCTRKGVEVQVLSSAPEFDSTAIQVNIQAPGISAPVIQASRSAGNSETTEISFLSEGRWKRMRCACRKYRSSGGRPSTFL